MEDKYKSMSAPELAGEDAFIRYVLKAEDQQSWTKWLEQHPGKQKSIEEAKLIVKALASAPAIQLPHDEQNELWDKIHHSIRQRGHTAVRRSNAFVRWSLAAAAVLALTIWINTTKGEKFVAWQGEQIKVELPESSHVTVNAGSTVSYKRDFKSRRTVKLEGEAFFEVEPGSTFRVITDHGSVTVLGTSFNVISREGRFEVTCYTGKVKVKNTQNRDALITAGEKITQTGTSLQKETVPEASSPLWMEGKFIFDNAPLRQVADELERQFDIRIRMNRHLHEKRFTGSFEKGDVEKALYVVTWPLHLRYEKKGVDVTISE
jgi:ferric-dicitrate binding protein FerR (iron transport regulator)